MVSNVKDLNYDEREKYKIAYIDYFKNYCIEAKDYPMFISKIKLMLNAGGYTKEMLRRIDNGDSISYVTIVDGNIWGFMTGYINKTSRQGVITHIYFNGHTKENYRNVIALELFKEFVEDLKSKGCSYVFGDAAYNDPVLIDAFESLGFQVCVETLSEVGYGKSI